MINLERIALHVFKALFSDQNMVKIDEEQYPLKKTSKSQLKYFEIEGYKFMEQNPEKTSRWAKMAQEGHQIMWIMQGFKYLGQVRDGQYHDFSKKE